MIDQRSNSFRPLIGAKLIKIKFEDNEFHFIFDNKRQFTGLLKIQVNDGSIVPKLEAFCGYCQGHEELVTR